MKSSTEIARSSLSNAPLLVLPFLGFLILYGYFLLPELRHDCPDKGDYLLAELSVDIAKDFAATTGPYSRFGFRHPGPILYYYYAISEPLLQFIETAWGRHLAAQFLLNAVLLAAALLLAFQIFKRSFAPSLLFLVVLFVFQHSTRSFLYNVWNPAVVVIPMLLFVLASSAVASGSLGYIFLQTLAATIALHNHLGVFPVVAGVGALSLIRCCRNRSCSLSRREVLSLLGAIVFVSITSLPILVDQFGAHGGRNLSKMAEFVSHPREKALFGEAISFVAYYFRVALLPTGVRFPPFVLIALLSLVLLVTRGTKGTVERELTIVLAATVCISLVAATQLTGELHRYLMWYELAPVALVYLLFLLKVVEWLDAVRLKYRLSLPWSSHSRVWAYVGGIAAFVCALAILPPRMKGETVGRCYEPYENMLARTTLAPDRRYIWGFSDLELSPKIAAMAFVMRKKGYDLCFSRSWGYAVDSGLFCDADSKNQNDGKPPVMIRMDFAGAPPTYQEENTIHEDNVKLSWDTLR